MDIYSFHGRDGIAEKAGYRLDIHTRRQEPGGVGMAEVVHSVTWENTPHDGREPFPMPVSRESAMEVQDAMFAVFIQGTKEAGRSRDCAAGVLRFHPTDTELILPDTGELLIECDLMGLEIDIPHSESQHFPDAGASVCGNVHENP